MNVHNGWSTSYLPSLRSGGHFEVSLTLSLVRGNDRWAAEARDNGASTVITTLAGAFLAFLGNVDSQDRGDKSSDESELHGEGIA